MRRAACAVCNVLKRRQFSGARNFLYSGAENCESAAPGSRSPQIPPQEPPPGRRALQQTAAPDKNWPKRVATGSIAKRETRNTARFPRKILFLGSCPTSSVWRRFSKRCRTRPVPIRAARSAPVMFTFSSNGDLCPGEGAKREDTRRAPHRAAGGGRRSRAPTCWLRGHRGRSFLFQRGSKTNTLAVPTTMDVAMPATHMASIQRANAASPIIAIMPPKAIH